MGTDPIHLWAHKKAFNLHSLLSYYNTKALLGAHKHGASNVIPFRMKTSLYNA